MVAYRSSIDMGAELMCRLSRSQRLASVFPIVLLAVLAVGLLTGCQTSGLDNLFKSRYEIERDKQDAERAEAERYCDSLFNDMRFAPIKEKVGRYGNETTFSMLANQSYPTSQEKEAILAFAQAKEACNQRSTGANDGRLHQAFMALLADLYKGELTYGEFGKLRNEMNSHYDALYRQEAMQRLNAFSNFMNMRNSLSQRTSHASSTNEFTRYMLDRQRIQQQNQQQNQGFRCYTNYIGSTAYTDCSPR
jgi:hypothetical protein